MPETRLARTRRAYDRVIDLGPYGCKLRMEGEPDNQQLNRVWERKWRAPHENAAERLGWNDLTRGEH